MEVRSSVDIIREGWQSSSVSDSFDRGVEACQLRLRQLIRGGSTNPMKRISEFCDQIDGLSKGALTDQVKEEIARLRLELEHLYMKDALFCRQRCKNKWARERDRNTRFFHAKASKRRRNNSITGLQNSAGVWKEKVEEVEGIILEYFGSLFQTSSPDPSIIDEVTHAISQLSPLKSPNSDGFPTVFFQKYWHILGSDVSCCLLNFLNNRHLP